MKLSDQAMGAIMGALQKCILEQTDIVPILKSFEFDKEAKRWGGNGQLVVTNPPSFTMPANEEVEQVPKYVYECSSCEEQFEVRHSIKDVLTDCDVCKSEDTLQRIPSLPTVINNSKPTGGEKAGTLVKRFIEEASAEIKSEKKELSQREYKG